MNRSILFLLNLLAAAPALATDGLFTSIHHSYVSPRALGMGDAFVALSNDYSAMFYNPAALARLDEGQVNLSMDAAASAGFATVNKDLQDTSDIKDETERTIAYINLLQKNYGKNFSIRTGPFEGIFVQPGWSFGILPANTTIDLAFHNQAAPALSLRAYVDTTVAYGFGTDVKSDNLGGRLSWGMTGKFINRGYFSKDVNALDLVADSQLLRKEDLREGATVDADIGFLYTPFLPTEGLFSTLRWVRPSFAMVVRNVGETGFGQELHLLKKEKTTEAPEKNYRVLDIGTRWEYPAFWIFSGRGTMDLRDIGHPYFTARKGFHAGLEFDWTMASWWKGQYRIGVNQGYPTLGASALFTIFRLDLVTYGEDIGSYDSPKENRIYMVKLNIDI